MHASRQRKELPVWNTRGRGGFFITGFRPRSDGHILFDGLDEQARDSRFFFRRMNTVQEGKSGIPSEVTV